VLGLEAIDHLLGARPDLPYADAWRIIVLEMRAADELNPEERS
jgi:hypothetical protein